MTPETSSPRGIRSSRGSSGQRAARSLRSLRRAAHRPIALLLPAACCLLLLGGCGDDDQASSQAATDKTRAIPALPPAESEKRSKAGSGRGGVDLTEIGEFEAPVYLTQPPGEEDDLYVVEQGGTIQRVGPDGERETFLDISDQVVAGGEQGLLSMAFAPDYPESGLFYVYLTDPEGDSRVVEFAASGGTADPESRRDVLRVDQPFPNHNGGLLLFGPDDRLYIGLGDGGGADDPDRRALDLGDLLGKLLRIDPREKAGRPYSVPADNPFVGEEGARGEIYSYGLRNPWRFSFDRETGALTIGDVGQEEQEEVDVVGAGEGSGANFGWSAFEGDAPFNEDQEAPDAVAPTLVASHEDGNCSITGGVVVRDRDLTTLYGRYVWGDFCLGELRSFTARPGSPATDDRPLGLSVESVSSFAEDQAGNVYAISLGGPVYRLDPAE